MSLEKIDFNNKKKYFISIITPVYNGIRFMEKCINNVISQNCEEMEHLIIDGGSTDGTVEVIRKYAGKYKHIKWISEKDLGQSDAMNKGIMAAQGRILGFLNVDDYYEDNVFNKVITLFKTFSEPTILIGNLNMWDLIEGKIKSKTIVKPKNIKPANLILGIDCKIPYNPTSYFYHAKIHEIIGLYDLSLNYNMDTDFILKASGVANVEYIDEIIGNFVVHENSKTYFSATSGIMGKIDREVWIKNINRLNPGQKIFYRVMYEILYILRKIYRGMKKNILGIKK